MTAKDEGSLREAAPLILVDTPIAVTFLPGEDIAARVKATVAVRELGVEPMPHFSARRITSEDDFEGYLRAVVGRAGVSRAFIVAGDPPAPIGPYFDTSALIATGAFERSGIKAIGIGGHPEGHPDMTEQQCWDVLGKKVREIEAGMVGINTNMIAGADSPFGGVRWSGHGAEDGPEGVLACMVAKAVHEG
jgi:methylenetetrahydrofolate reductase (NADPH)